MDTVCLWDLSADADASTVSVQLASVADAVHGIRGDADKTSGRATATRAYNAISKFVRKGQFPRGETYPVTVHQFETLPSTSGGKYGASESFIMQASILNMKLLAYLVIEKSNQSTERDAGQGLRILCHFPVLGEPHEFVCHSALSFSESQRLAAEDSAELSEATIHAPMPCKVLQLIKKNGEEVSKGEIVIVIESMKMEITITAGKAGRFKANASEGEAVSEGSALCYIE